MWSLFRRKRRQTKPARYTATSVHPRLEALEDRLCPSGGMLDPTFGGTGEVTIPSSTIQESARGSVAIYPATDMTGNAGKIVSVGGVPGISAFGPEIGVIRMNSEGSPDTSFNKTGSATLKVGPYASADAVAIQPDGKIVVAGGAYPTSKALQNHTNEEFVVARFNANGSLDTTFGNKGIFTWSPTSNQSVQSLSILSNGNIVAAGNSSSATGKGQDAAVFELSPSGKLVTSFGSGGLAAYQPVEGTAVDGMAVAPDGDLLLAGTDYIGNGALLLAVNQSTGQLDPNFNGQGWLDFIPAGFAGTAFYGVTIQGNDIVVAGTGSTPNGSGSYARGLLARFNPNGTLDTSFATNGFYTTPNHNYFYGVATELDGSLVVSGDDVGVSPAALTVGHFTANGQLDTTFGGAGTGFNEIQGVNNWLRGVVAIDAEGRIVVGGVNSNNGSVYIRLTPPAAMIGSFTANPNPVTSGSSVTLTASNIAADGSTITQVTFYYYDSSGNQVVLGYGTPDGQGDWTLTLTVNLAPGTYTLYSQAEDGYGAFGDPDALTLTVQ